MDRETGVQSPVESYQRLKKWYLMLPCLALSIIRYGSRVKWSNPGKGVAPPLHLGVVAIEKAIFGSPSTMVANFTYFLLYFLNCIEECCFLLISDISPHKSYFFRFVGFLLDVDFSFILLVYIVSFKIVYKGLHIVLVNYNLLGC